MPDESLVHCEWNKMWRFLLLATLASVSTVLVSQAALTARPSIPTRVDLRTETRKDTDTAGGGNNGWKQRVHPATTPTNAPFCDCPGENGWTPKQLEEHRLRTDLKGGSKDCFCSSNNYHWLNHAYYPLFGNRCSCPSVEGWSLKDLQHYQSISKINGTVHDCFCSFFGRYTMQDLVPHGPAVNCTCPEYSGWTEDQLLEIERLKNLTALSNECFCEDENEYSIRRKVKLIDNHEEGSECGNV
ncbi:hypothetical protein C0J52_03278 [Blattella germanica]|nr:hypothetical protein C0J52_03278 [Blattella germanica]